MPGVVDKPIGAGTGTYCKNCIVTISERMFGKVVSSLLIPDDENRMTHSFGSPSTRIQ